MRSLREGTECARYCQACKGEAPQRDARCTCSPAPPAAQDLGASALLSCDDPSTAGWPDTHAGLCEPRREAGVQGGACASHASPGNYLQEACAVGQGSDTPPDADADRRPLPGSFQEPGPVAGVHAAAPAAPEVTGRPWPGEWVQPCRTARPVFQEEPSWWRQGPVGRRSGECF